MSDGDHPLETITPDVEEAIFRFHKDHEGLGHGGIMHLLTDAGYDVDSHELKVFLKRHNIKGDRWTATWRRGIRNFWWLGGPHSP